MTKANIKVKINYPETEEGMKTFEEIKIESFYVTLKEILNKNELKILGEALKRNNSV